MSNNGDHPQNPQLKPDFQKELGSLTRVPYAVAHDTLKELGTISCTYLIYLGTVSEVGHVFEPPIEASSDAFVCKFGMSEDLCKRLYQHKLDYGRLTGIDVQLMYYVNMPKAEIRNSERRLLGSFCENGMRQVLKDKSGSRRKEIIVFENTDANMEQILEIFSEAAGCGGNNATNKLGMVKNTVNKTNIKRKSGKATYSCECGKSYIFRSGLSRHQMSGRCASKFGTRNSITTVYYCQCGNSYSRKNNLMRHQRKEGCKGGVTCKHDSDGYGDVSEFVLLLLEKCKENERLINESKRKDEIINGLLNAKKMQH